MKRVPEIVVHEDFLEVTYRLFSRRVVVERAKYIPKEIDRLIRPPCRHGITDLYMESTSDYYLILLLSQKK